MCKDWFRCLVLHNSYTKPNNEIKYIQKNWSHPPSVIRQITLSIVSSLSTLSFKKKRFQEAVPPHQKPLKNSGFRHTLTYKRPQNDSNSTNINKFKQNRKRQIKWFNPPFNLKTKKIWQFLLKAFRQTFSSSQQTA